MLYLLLAIVCSALISILMRFSEGRTGGKLSVLAMNYLMCLTLAGTLFFKERLGKRQWIAMVAIAAALILLNI